VLEIARTIIDSNLYMVLGTADETGHPWVSPVYFAHAGYATFIWVSRPGRQHSRNLMARPEVSLVIYDSRVPISTGQAVYAIGVADEVPPEAVPELIQVFSDSAIARGGSPWIASDVVSPAPHRLYRVAASQLWVTGDDDDRVPVSLEGQ
jgi:hypothetical protein